MTIGLDIDGVIRNFTGSFNVVYNDMLDNIKENFYHLYTEKQKKIPLDYEPVVYNMEDDIYDKSAVDKIFNGIEIYSVLSNAKIYPKSVEFIKELKEIADNIFFITHQPNQYCVEATLDWLKKNSGILGLASCIFCEGDDKWKYCDILIDDRPKSIQSANRNGKIGICMERPWNQSFETQYKGDRKKIVEIIKSYENKI